MQEVLFKGTSEQVDLYITTFGLSYVFHRINDPIDQQQEKRIDLLRIDQVLLGANISKENISTSEPLLYYNNYY